MTDDVWSQLLPRATTAILHPVTRGPHRVRSAFRPWERERETETETERRDRDRERQRQRERERQ